MVLEQNPLFIRGIGKIGGPILNRIFGGTLRSPALPRLPKTFGPAAIPKVSGAVRTVSALGKTRAGLNLSGRTVFAIGAGTAATGFGAFSVQRLTEPGPGGMSAIETAAEGAKDIAEDLGPGFEEFTKFLRENGPIIALAIGGIVLIGLIK